MSDEAGRFEAQRDDWQETARIYALNVDSWRNKALTAEAEVAALTAERDGLWELRKAATEVAVEWLHTRPLEDLTTRQARLLAALDALALPRGEGGGSDDE